MNTSNVTFIVNDKLTKDDYYQHLLTRHMHESFVSPNRFRLVDREIINPVNDNGIIELSEALKESASVPYGHLHAVPNHRMIREIRINPDPKQFLGKLKMAIGDDNLSYILRNEQSFVIAGSSVLYYITENANTVYDWTPNDIDVYTDDGETTIHFWTNHIVQNTDTDTFIRESAMIRKTKHGILCGKSYRLVNAGINIIIDSISPPESIIRSFDSQCTQIMYYCGKLYCTRGFITAIKTGYNVYSGRRLPVKHVNKYIDRGFGAIYKYYNIKPLMLRKKLFEVNDVYVDYSEHSKVSPYAETVIKFHYNVMNMVKYEANYGIYICMLCDKLYHSKAYTLCSYSMCMSCINKITGGVDICQRKDTSLNHGFQVTTGVACPEKYIFNSSEAFTKFYKLISRHRRVVFYEILQNKKLNSLFFDIDADTKEVDCQLIHKCVLDAMVKLYEYNDPIIMFELISNSKRKKGSYHLVFPQIRFSSLYDMKKFVEKEIIARIKMYNKSKRKIKLNGYYDVYYIQTAPKYMRPEFIDTKVYRNNQLFRLPLSSKYLKNDDKLKYDSIAFMTRNSYYYRFDKGYHYRFNHNGYGATATWFEYGAEVLDYIKDLADIAGFDAWFPSKYSAMKHEGKIDRVLDRSYVGSTSRLSGLRVVGKYNEVIHCIKKNK